MRGRKAPQGQAGGDTDRRVPVSILVELQGLVREEAICWQRLRVLKRAREPGGWGLTGSSEKQKC